MNPRYGKQPSPTTTVNTYPKGDDNKEHLEEHSEDLVVGEGHRHDA